MPDPKPPRALDLLQKGMSRLFDKAPAPSQPAVPLDASPDASARPTPTLAAVAQLQIQFLDNAKRPLYPLPGRGTGPLSRDEEHVALSRCMEALHEARKAASILGKPASGAYVGRDPEVVMAEATAEDLHAFLAFVLAYPRGFMNRPVRFSEAFLAWLVDHGEV